MAAAVVDVACADGKLSWLGVPTLTATAGSCGRWRRTTRLITTAAACAAKAPDPARIQSRRRPGDRTAPSADTINHPMLCSPKCDIARVTGSAPGRPANADCTATIAATSPEGELPTERASATSGAMSWLVIGCGAGGRQQHRLPLLLAGQDGQGVAIGPAHLIEAAGELALPAHRLQQQRKHLGPIALPVHHAAPVGGGDGDAVDGAQ